MTGTARLENHLIDVGTLLAERGNAVLGSIPDCPAGPILLAKLLKVDKATASRFLRAVASRDPIDVLRLIPGPEPLRVIADAAGRHGAGTAAVEAFREAVNGFDAVIRAEAGDRSGLDALLMAWLPDAREDFELKRKQAVFRNISQLKGKVAQTSLATALIHPSADGAHLDVVWIFGCLRLQRLRPGVLLNFASRRVAVSHGPGTTRTPRRPRTLAGEEAENLTGLLLPRHCSVPLPPVRIEPAGDVMHYVLETTAFGPSSAVDVVFAEVNRDELPRYVALVPRKKRYVYTDVPIPSERLVFDALIHQDVVGTGDVGLLLYDTASRGMADVNDRARDIDRLDLRETLKPLGRGLRQARLSEAPWYGDLLAHVCQSLNWDEQHFVGHRARIDFPLHGTQIAITYDAQEKP